MAFNDSQLAKFAELITDEVLKRNRPHPDLRGFSALEKIIAPQVIEEPKLPVRENLQADILAALHDAVNDESKRGRHTTVDFVTDKEGNLASIRLAFGKDSICLEHFLREVFSKNNVLYNGEGKEIVVVYAYDYGNIYRDVRTFEAGQWVVQDREDIAYEGAPAKPGNKLDDVKAEAAVEKDGREIQ